MGVDFNKDAGRSGIDARGYFSSFVQPGSTYLRGGSRRSLAGHLLDIRGAQQHPHLKHNEVHKANDKDALDEDGLEAHHEHPAPSLPIKALPGIDEADSAGTSEKLGSNLASESAVEGDDGVLVLWQERGLDADEGDVGGQDDEEDAGEEGGEDAQHAEDGADGGDVAGIVADVDEEEDADGDVGGEVLSCSSDGTGEEDALEVLGRDHALPEVRLGWHGDDLVRPCCVERSQDSAGDGKGNEVADGVDGAGENSHNNVGKDVGGDIVEDEDEAASPWCPPAGLGLEVAEGVAERGGEGLLGYERNLGAGLEEVLFGFVMGIALGSGDGDGGRGCLDHGKRCYDKVQHIVNLRQS